MPTPLLLVTAAAVAVTLLAGSLGSVGRSDGVEVVLPAGGPLATEARVDTIADGPVCRGRRPAVDCVVWDVRFPARARIDAAVLDGLVVTVATDGRVVARTVDTGTPVWTHRIELPAAPSGGPPTLRDPRRLAEPVRILGEVDGMVALRSGPDITFLERVVGGVAAQVPAPVEPLATAAVDAWLMLTDGQRVASLLTNGVSTWTVEVPDGAAAAVTSHGAYLTDGAHVTQLSKVAGLPRWEATLPGPALPLPPRTTDSGLFAVGGDEPAIVALAEPDGTRRWQLPLRGELLELTLDEHRLVAVADGPDGVEVSIATVRDSADEQRWSARFSLGRGVSGVQAPRTAGDTIAIVAANPHPTLWLATLEGRLLLRERLPTVPYGLALPDQRTVLLADATGVRARAIPTGAHLWHVGLRNARVLADDPPVVAADRGLTRLRPSEP